MTSLRKAPRLKPFVFLLLCIPALFSFKAADKQYRETIDLSGRWQFAPDEKNANIGQKLLSPTFADSILLPGTTDTNHKGKKNDTRTTMHLNRNYVYEGQAWYRKEVVIPANWENRSICLFMERTKPTKVWVDGQFAGESILLESPQEYDLSRLLTPGRHIITLCIDNNAKRTPYGGVHMYSDDTQTNWNGVIGRFCLEASAPLRITDLKITPDIENKKAVCKIKLNRAPKSGNVSLDLFISKEENGKTEALPPAGLTLKSDSTLTATYNFSDISLWDEYHQPLYKINAVVSDGKQADNRSTTFGMRKFATRGTQFTINGRTTFLRGKHDGCVFPLTGFPPMDTAGWMRVFLIAKSYGINHYRFHTWCPPEAAFTAADHLGIYLQPELPFWGGLDADSTATMLTKEGIALLKNYANHPSFVMFGMGNEIWSGHERVKKVLTALKQSDSRPLYSEGSNNNIGYALSIDEEDYHVAARTPFAHDSILTHIRLIHAFCDSKDGGILNTVSPSTQINYDYGVTHITKPLISHEIGQYQVYPDYKEIAKYTGVLNAANLEEFRDRLTKADMIDQNQAFTKASGALAALCYRAEIEAALRTKGMAGFHLLDLQDYPGQGTALVGILDAFMDSKEVISRDEWSHFCNDVVPLLSFEKYCWSDQETFSANVEVANYSDKTIHNNISWKLVGENGRVWREGKLKKRDIANGQLSNQGTISFSFSSMQTPERLNLEISIDSTTYRNNYPIWLYPTPETIEADPAIIVTESLNKETMALLKNGGNVLLFPQPDSVAHNSVKGLFNPEFWNFGMFKSISESNKKPVSPGTMGLLMDPMHPLFDLFPTDFYTNWQWWSIIRNSNPLNLNTTSKAYRPIVQVIDNLERNNKFGLIFEFKMGKGKLLICMSQLGKIADKPEANQLYRSILDYMHSEKFNPEFSINEEELRTLLK
ncbi:sugar-binding domain-containing protein [Paludibacter jiangxiensis]|uniref:Glycosyl hydrolases family 2 n=1 Tax=Paludibacter jiangxiensis TaxID=681398 RepID=A0A170Y7Y4_9BACT|nr:sugar-binding domain-containing protein [Paludibacter jiangxiensis]GAT61582.1 glycosyl hydrolases family 2 [Paludibacter jiangxiensis]